MGVTKGTTKDCLSNPCSKEGHLEQVSQECAQLIFGYLQECRLINILEQPVPVFDHPCTKKACPRQYLVFCMFCPLLLVLSQSSTKSLSPSILLSAPSQAFIPDISPKPSLLQMKQSWAFLWRQILQLLNWLCDLMLDRWLGTFVQSPASVSCRVGTLKEGNKLMKKYNIMLKQLSRKQSKATVTVV